MSARPARAALRAARGLAAALPLAALLSGCPAKARPPKEAAPPPAEAAAAKTAFPQAPAAIIIAGAVPLWFEFAPRLPRHIDRIEDAQLSAWAPWPQTFHATGLLPFENGLALAINRCGFLAILSGGPERLLFYPFEEAAFFPRYTASAPFYLEGAPSVILSGNDFFLNEVLPPPEQRVFSLASGEKALRPARIPAFFNYAAKDAWDIDHLFPSPEGLWYFKARKKTKPKGAIVYARTAASGMSEKVEEVSLTAYYDAQKPGSAAALDGRVARLLEGAGLGEAAWALSVFSPDSGGKLRFSGAGSGGAAPEDGAPLPELCAFYGDTREEEEGGGIANAVLLVPAASWGAAFILFYDENGFIKRQELPPLPESFIWTAAGIAGNTLIAAWEERDHWNTGAAGFCAVALTRLPY